MKYSYALYSSIKAGAYDFFKLIDFIVIFIKILPSCSMLQSGPDIEKAWAIKFSLFYCFSDEVITIE